jgi:glycosyltransferase involved in cell wall biosynthesis
LTDIADSSLIGGLVSVVMAAFDEEAFIGEALASVLGQSYRPVEVIVVDDGSGDRTAEIAAGYGVRLLRRPHVGAAAARNAGLAVACGEFWTIFDADDVMPRERIARQVEHLRRNPEDGIVLGLTEAFVSPGEPRPTHFNPAWDDGPFPACAGTMLARREVLAAVGPYDNGRDLAYDVEWLARAKDAGVQAGHVDQVCLGYRIHRANTSADARAVHVEMFKLLRESLGRRRVQLTD